MYKGYKILEGKRFYRIYNEKGVVCGVGCIGYLKDKSKKDVIDEYLKRLIPKKPKKEFKTSLADGKLHIEIKCFCPECNGFLGDADDFYKYNSCPSCYQRIDWSGV